MRNRILSRVWGLVLLLVVLGPSSGKADQIAASVEYRFVARPAGISNDLQPPLGSSLKFLSIKAADDFVVDASLCQPEANKRSETTLVLMVHGSGGDYSRAPNSTLDQALAAGCRGVRDQQPAT